MTEKLLDVVENALLSSPPHGLQAEYDMPSLENVANVACEFLKKQIGANEVRVTKLAQIDAENGGWEAEAEVYIPNAAIAALRLPIQRIVMDCCNYILRIDRQLNVIAYCPRDLMKGNE